MFYNGTEDFNIISLGDGLWQIDTPVTSLSLGIYDLQIIANAMNYQLKPLISNVKLMNIMPLRLILLPAPTSQTWV